MFELRIAVKNRTLVNILKWQVSAADVIKTVLYFGSPLKWQRDGLGEPKTQSSHPLRSHEFLFCLLSATLPTSIVSISRHGNLDLGRYAMRLWGSGVLGFWGSGVQGKFTTWGKFTFASQETPGFDLASILLSNPVLAN